VQNGNNPGCAEQCKTRMKHRLNVQKLQKVAESAHRMSDNVNGSRMEVGTFPENG